MTISYLCDQTVLYSTRGALIDMNALSDGLVTRTDLKTWHRFLWQGSYCRASTLPRLTL